MRKIRYGLYGAIIGDVVGSKYEFNNIKTKKFPLFSSGCSGAGESKDSIRDFVSENYYALNETLDQIRPKYSFDVSCQGSVPQAIIAFLESHSFEDAIRNAVSMGGDSDTIGAIAGSIAWAYYYDRSDDTFSHLMDTVNKYLPQEFIRIIEEFESVRHV